MAGEGSFARQPHPLIRLSKRWIAVTRLSGVWPAPVPSELGAFSARWALAAPGSRSVDPSGKGRG